VAGTVGPGCGGCDRVAGGACLVPQERSGVAAHSSEICWEIFPERTAMDRRLPLAAEAETNRHARLVLTLRQGRSIPLVPVPAARPGAGTLRCSLRSCSSWRSSPACSLGSPHGL
jgi:hypothetical protein